MLTHTYLHSLLGNMGRKDLQISVIPVSILNSYIFYEAIFAKADSKVPKDILKGSKSVIQLGLPVDMTKEYYQPLSVKDAYKGYGDIFEITKFLVKSLNQDGFRSKRATLINQKYCAVKSGQGVLGRNGLILSKEFGTRLRFDAIVSDYVPDDYDKPIEEDLCGNCSRCIDACKHSCLVKHPHSCEDIIDRQKCYEHYIKHPTVIRSSYMCNSCQYVCPYNRTYIEENHVKEINY